MDKQMFVSHKDHIVVGSTIDTIIECLHLAQRHNHPGASALIIQDALGIEPDGIVENQLASFACHGTASASAAFLRFLYAEKVYMEPLREKFTRRRIAIPPGYQKARDTGFEAWLKATENASYPGAGEPDEDRIQGFLIKHSISINAHFPPYGRTMLTAAVREGLVARVRLLLRHGADVAVRDGVSQSVFSVSDLSVEEPVSINPLEVSKDLLPDLLEALFRSKGFKFKSKELVRLFSCMPDGGKFERLVKWSLGLRPEVRLKCEELPPVDRRYDKTVLNPEPIPEELLELDRLLDRLRATDGESYRSDANGATAGNEDVDEGGDGNQSGGDVFVITAELILIALTASRLSIAKFIVSTWTPRFVVTTWTSRLRPAPRRQLTQEHVVGFRSRERAAIWMSTFREGSGHEHLFPDIPPRNKHSVRGHGRLSKDRANRLGTDDRHPTPASPQKSSWARHASSPKEPAPSELPPSESPPSGSSLSGLDDDL